MTTFDNLPNEIVEYIYKHVHKSRIEDVHKELYSVFQGVYRKNFVRLKYKEAIQSEHYDPDDYLDDYPDEDCLYEISKINDKFDKINDIVEYPSLQKSTRVLWSPNRCYTFDALLDTFDTFLDTFDTFFEQVDYLMNNCNNHDLESWWDENEGFDYESDDERWPSWRPPSPLRPRSPLITIKISDPETGVLRIIKRRVRKKNNDDD